VTVVRRCSWWTTRGGEINKARIVLLVLVLGLLPLGGEAPASPEPPPPAVWVADADGGNARRLAEYLVMDHFEWSPDGSTFVYRAADGLYVSDAPGRSATPIPGTGDYWYDLRWSPDGRWIAYGARDGESNSLRVTTPDGRESKVLVGRRASVIDWSPDSTRLSFTAREGESNNLYVIDLATGAESLVATDVISSATRWSPDWRFVAITRSFERVVVRSSEDGSESEVLGGMGFVSDLSWSPDGRALVIDADDNLYVVSPDGSGRRLLTTGGSPDWSPDGTRIVFARGGDVFSISPDGSAGKQLTFEHLRDDRHARYSPDMTRIAFEGTPVQVLCGGRRGEPFPLEATLVGSPGNDVLMGTDRFDVIAGLGGADVIEGLGGDDVVCGGDGDDTLLGGEGSDTLYADAGADRVQGENGADRLEGGDGRDVVRGGPGRDGVVFFYADGPVHVDLSARYSSGAGRDELHSVENAYGSIEDDVLIGDGAKNVLSGFSFAGHDYPSGDDVLIGRGGDDRLAGLTGDDELYGREGNDRLDGGEGRDLCVPGPGRDAVESCARSRQMS
jgi:Tol biopolymer transport system component